MYPAWERDWEGVKGEDRGEKRVKRERKKKKERREEGREGEKVDIALTRCKLRV